MEMLRFMSHARYANLEVSSETPRSSEASGGWISRILGRIPIVRYVESERHKEVARQLAIRDKFPSEAWDYQGIDPAKAEIILAKLPVQFDWPNHHFLPSDPLRLAMEEGVNEYGLEEFVLDIRDEFGSTVTREEVVRLVQNKSEVSDLIARIVGDMQTE